MRTWGLRRLAETALKKLQEGPSAEHGNEELDTIMPQLIRDFKDAISEMYLTGEMCKS